MFAVAGNTIESKNKNKFNLKLLLLGPVIKCFMLHMCFLLLQASTVEKGGFAPECFLGMKLWLFVLLVCFILEVF